MNTNFLIRNYQPSDYQEITILWEKTEISNPKRCDTSEVIEKTLQCGGKFFVLVDIEKNLILGTSWLTNDGRRIYLHHFAVLPEYQGKGLSKPLMRESLRFAKQQQMQIRLEVHKNNVKALNLYKKYGFAYLGEYETYIIRNINEINENR